MQREDGHKTVADLRDLDELVVVVLPVEERLLPKDLSQTPHSMARYAEGEFELGTAYIRDPSLAKKLGRQPQLTIPANIQPRDHISRE